MTARAQARAPRWRWLRSSRRGSPRVSTRVRKESLGSVSLPGRLFRLEARPPWLALLSTGEHYIGKPIKVLRSSGEYSPATVVAYDDVMETCIIPAPAPAPSLLATLPFGLLGHRYTVNVGEEGTTWGIKNGVESGEIAPADHIAAMAGDFVSGLRVTVRPALALRAGLRPPNLLTLGRLGRPSGPAPETECVEALKVREEARCSAHEPGATPRGAHQAPRRRSRRRDRRDTRPQQP